jgi:hypothetical protein
LVPARTTVPSHVPAALAAPLAAVAALVLVASAHAGAWVPAPGEHYTEFRGSLFSADSWHDAGGARSPLIGGGLWESRDLVMHHELGWRRRAALFFTMPWQSTTRRTGDDAWSRTETGFADLTVGMRVRLHQSRSALSVDLGWKAPMGYERDAVRYGAASGPGRVPFDVTGAPADGARPYVSQYPARLGEGQQDLFATANFGTPLGRFGFLDLAGGYRYRFEDPADEIVARADLGLWLGSRLLVGGRYLGSIASGDGDAPGDAITRHLVGPVVTLRVDDRMDVFAGSLHTASAENALHTDQFVLGLALKQTQLDRLQGWLGGTRRP